VPFGGSSGEDCDPWGGGRHTCGRLWGWRLAPAPFCAGGQRGAPEAQALGLEALGCPKPQNPGAGNSHAPRTGPSGLAQAKQGVHCKAGLLRSRDGPAQGSAREREGARLRGRAEKHRGW